MKIIITERQYSLYLKRRYNCLREYIDKLKSGEQLLSVPSSSFEWDTYKYVITATLRGYCTKDFGQMFDEDIHNEIMDLFGDELYEIYNMSL